MNANPLKLSRRKEFHGATKLKRKFKHKRKGNPADEMAD